MAINFTIHSNATLLSPSIPRNRLLASCLHYHCTKTLTYRHSYPRSMQKFVTMDRHVVKRPSAPRVSYSLFRLRLLKITSSNQRLWVRSTPYSNFNTDTLNDFPIWLLTSVYCKINIFSSTTGVLHKDISVAKSMPFWSNRTGPGTNCVAWRCQFP